MSASRSDKEMLDKIDEWHETKPGMPLHTFLGMTWDEYCDWVTDPRAFYDKRGNPIDGVH